MALAPCLAVKSYWGWLLTSSARDGYGRRMVAELTLTRLDDPLAYQIRS